MVNRWNGFHSGQRIVDITAGEQLADNECPACASRDIQTVTSHAPVVDFLNPVRGMPYPTFAANWTKETKNRCRDCGASWGHYEIGRSCAPEDLPYNIHTHMRIDEELGSFVS
jgi:hypothetical protein